MEINAVAYVQNYVQTNVKINVEQPVKKNVKTVVKQLVMILAIQKQLHLGQLKLAQIPQMVADKIAQQDAIYIVRDVLVIARD